MKNIHIVPTDKQIKNVGDLVKDQYGDIHIFTKNDGREYGKTTTKLNIYITNHEEIKEGVDQWYLDKVLNEPYNSGGAQYSSKQDVIILTTDVDLIKDGVQAIDDEFLEWFVKNASCEEVEIDKAEHGMYKDDVYYKLSNKIFYKIIIPREEETKCYCGHTTYCDCGPEEETLEEAAEIFVKNRFTKQICNDESYPDIYASKAAIVESHILFAKWKQEKSYSEEEVKLIERLISFYWVEYNSEHPNNLKEFELSKSILEKLNKKK